MLLLLGRRYSLGPNATADDEARAHKACAILRHAAKQPWRMGELLFGKFLAADAAAAATAVKDSAAEVGVVPDADEDFNLTGRDDPPAVVAAAAAGRCIAAVTLYRKPQLQLSRLQYPWRDGDHVLRRIGQVRTLLEDLAVLHAHNLVHGDVRAANIVCHVTDPTEARFIDFDLTRRTHQPYVRCYNGALPERAELGLASGMPMVPRHDLYAFGTILAGYMPVTADMATEVEATAENAAEETEAAATKAAAEHMAKANKMWRSLVDELQRPTATASRALSLIKLEGAVCGWLDSCCVLAY